MLAICKEEERGLHKNALPTQMKIFIKAKSKRKRDNLL